MHWPFALLLLFLVGCVLSIALMDNNGVVRIEERLIQAVQPDRAPLLPPPSRS
jgi:hypothetical protein